MNSGASVPGLLADLLRLDGAHRPHSLSVPALAPADGAWVVAAWHGHELLGPSAGRSGLVPAALWVDVLSTAQDLSAALGQPAALHTQAADGSRMARSGLVAAVECRGGDPRLWRHRLQLVPWTWLLTHGRHSRVFQDAPVLAIVEAVLADYAPWAAWQVADDVAPFLAERPPRSYCVQYRESDADFLARLLAEEGLGLRLDEAADAPAGHRVQVFADSAALPEVSCGGAGIRFHRGDAAEPSDAVQAFGAVRALGANRVSLLGTDYRSVAAITASMPVGAGGADAGPREHYDPVGAYPFANREQADRAAGLLAQAMEARSERWLGHGTVRAFRAGQGFRLLGAPAGAGQAPPDMVLLGVWHAGVNPLPEGLQGLAEALPTALPGVPEATWAQVRRQAQALGYANAFVAQPRTVPWRPLPPCVDDDGDAAASMRALLPGADERALPRLKARPSALGYQTARVVGPDGVLTPRGAHELHCDALGRVHVRFHWQETGVAAAGATPAADSCWLRVAQRYAGPGVGTQFLPRIGQEVLVAFLGGDIDRPVIVGSLYNGRGDPAPGGQGNLVGGAAPAWHGAHPGADADRDAAAMSGFKSKEFGGSGHNRLVLDDSDGELRLQLATTHAASELTLGYLIHQQDNHRGPARGAGFELRTDQWGAVRAERGLWVSAYAAASPDAPAGEQVAAVALLKQAANLAATMSGIAITHLTPRLAAHEGVFQPGQSALTDTLPPLKALHASARALVPGGDWHEASAAPGVGGAGTIPPSGAPGAARAAGATVPQTADALLGLAAPAGIGLVAGKSLHWTTGETLTLASGQASNLVVAGDLRLHAGQSLGWLAGAVDGALQEGVALSLVTAEGELDLQAQNDSLKLQSRDGLRVVSANAEVELAAGKTVHLATSGGASITIEGGNISVACPGQITVHAGRKVFLGPATVNQSFVRWPSNAMDAPCMTAAAAAHGAFVRVL